MASKRGRIILARFSVGKKICAKIQQFRGVQAAAIAWLDGCSGCDQLTAQTDPAVFFSRDDQLQIIGIMLT